MSNDYTELFEAIREKCRQQRWYGPESCSPAYIQRLSIQSRVDNQSDDYCIIHYWYDEKRKPYQIHPDTDLSKLPVPHKFTYPPATEEQLRRTEEQLGFALHPCLRGLYTQVANGGFGPGCGIEGILGGYTSSYRSMVETHQKMRESGGLVGPEIYIAQIGDDGSLEFSGNVQPDQWLEFCGWGWIEYSYLDNRTGAVYRNVDRGVRGITRYECEAPSLEEWFRRWIDGTLIFNQEGNRFLTSPGPGGVEVPGFPISKKPKYDNEFPLRHDRSLPLWKRIHAWCQYAGWYGPDDYIDSINAYVDFVDEHLETVRPLADVEHGFEYPVASEEDIVRAEERMEYAHPPLLREIYLHLANGGFGPGQGLTGVPPNGFGWWVRLDPRYEGQPIDRPGLSELSLFDLDEYEKKHAYTNALLIGRREWPRHMIHLYSTHQEFNYYVHLPSGRVYLAEGGYGGLMANGEEIGVYLRWKANSLEEWLEHWLAGEEDKEESWLKSWLADDEELVPHSEEDQFPD